MALLLAGIFGFLGVAAGAFGAHALQGKLTPRDLEIYHKAVHYQLWHALALGLVGTLGLLERTQAVAAWLRASGIGFTVGVVIFSGSLYLLVFTGIRRFGMVTPLGGVGFLVGWLCLAVAAARLKSAA